MCAFISILEKLRFVKRKTGCTKYIIKNCKQLYGLICFERARKINFGEYSPQENLLQALYQ